ncbi:hypothetical protein ACFQZX_08110 [Mucilaginibacter litoreus]|uniref:Immunity protein 44 n=1 Tax=Mucilaginibacter litoreus TaxID=1048221 RepID=A0ABW3ARV4_9SPHI
MNFALTLEVTKEIVENGLDDLINSTSIKISEFLEDKSYGQGLETLYVGVVCVNPKFDFFFKERKPKYRKKEIIIQDGRPYELINCLTYDIKLDYVQVIHFTKSEFIKNLFLKLINSLEYLDSINIVDFNKNLFKTDLIKFLNIKNAIL